MRHFKITSNHKKHLFFSEYMHFRTKTIALTVTLTITITFPLKISTYLILIKTISSCYHVILTTQFTNKCTFQTDFFKRIYQLPLHFSTSHLEVIP